MRIRVRVRNLELSGTPETQGRTATMATTTATTPEAATEPGPEKSANAGMPATLAEALVKFQADLPVILKTKDGQDGHRQFKYADLSVIVRTCSPILARLGLSITSGTQVRDNRTVLVSKLMHVGSGEVETSEIDVTAPAGNMKPLGSNITYARRYNYGALLGLVTDEDTDMEGTEVVEPVRPDAPTQEQRDYLNAAAINDGVPVRQIMWNLFGNRVTPETITRDQMEELRHAVDNHQS